MLVPLRMPWLLGLSTRYSRVPGTLGSSLSRKVPLRLTFAFVLTAHLVLPSRRCWRTTLAPAARGVTLPRTLTTSSPTVTTSLFTFAVTVYAAARRSAVSAACAVVVVRASGPATMTAAAASETRVVVVRCMRFSRVSGARAGPLRGGDAAIAQKVADRER